MKKFILATATFTAVSLSIAEAQTFTVRVQTDSTPQFVVRVPASPFVVTPKPSPAVVRGYAEAWQEAVQSGKPLVVWLGYPPPLFVPPDVVYWYTPETDWEGYSGPGVVVSVPGDKGLYYAGFLSADKCSEANIRSVVAAEKARWFTRSAIMPQVQMPMMMPMMGRASFGRSGGRSGGC
jgi:hypothetical protein